MTSVKTWLRRLVAVAFAGCAAAVVIGASVSRGEARFYLPVAGFAMIGLICLAIGVVIHELGHLACAAIGSIPVYRVVIGDGPVLWRRRLRGIWFEVRRSPLSGCVEPYGVMNYRGRWWALFLLGGVLGNLAAAGAVLGLWALGATGFLLNFFLAAQVILIATAIVPIPHRNTDDDNDGMMLVRLLWRPAFEPAAMRASYDAQVAGYSPGHASPMTAASVRLLHHSRRFRVDGIPRTEVWDDLIHELERRDLSPQERMWVLDALVTDGLVSGDPALARVSTNGRSRPSRLDPACRRCGAAAAPCSSNSGAAGKARCCLRHWRRRTGTVRSIPS